MHVDSVESDLNLRKSFGLGSDLEKENKTLKENLLDLKKELSKFNDRPLIVCEVKSIFG